MPVLPAICDQCSTVFSSGFAIENRTRVSMVGCGAGPCPSCGAGGTIPDGLYDAFGDTLRILSDGPRSARSLERLATVLRAAQEHGLDREATAAAIEREAPEYADLAGDVRERRGWSLYQYLTILLMVIAIVAAHGTASNGLTEQQVEHLFHEFIDTHPVLSPSPTATPLAPATHHLPSKARKNDPCPCGSGRRYRRCHGAMAHS